MMVDPGADVVHGAPMARRHRGIDSATDHQRQTTSIAAMKVLVVNGPNLNLLGRRTPEVYGSTTLSALDNSVREWGSGVGLEVTTFQSNHEGAIVDRIHELVDTDTDLVINAGALTHMSYVLHDAIEAIERPTVEVHISNIHARESWRAHSLIQTVCETSIVGRGVIGYRWALEFLSSRRRSPATVTRYGPDPRQRVSVRDGSDPVVAIVHSGLDDPTAGWDQVETIAAHLAAEGRRTASIEYRPGSATEDVAAALTCIGQDTGIVMVLDGDAGSLGGDIGPDVVHLDPVVGTGTHRAILSGGDRTSRIFADRTWMSRPDLWDVVGGG